MKNKFALFAALFFVAIFLSPTVLAKGFSFTHVNLEYQFNPDASVNVTEELEFDFDGSFSWAEREIALSGSERIENFRVFEKTGAMSNEIFADVDYGAFNAKWWYRALNEKKVFVLTYTLKNAVKSYDDSYEFYWKIWGDSWNAQVGRLDAKLVFPKPLAEGSRVWLHPAIDSHFDLEGDLLTIYANNVPKNTFVEARVLFNKEVMAGTYAQKRSGSGIQKVESDEQNSQLLTGALEFLWIWPILVFVILAIAFYYFYKKYGVEPIALQDGYERFVPFADKPYLVDYLMHLDITQKGMIATLMDLARRGHIQVEKDKEPLGLMFGDNYRFTRLTGKDALSQPEELLIDLLFVKSKGWLSFGAEEKAQTITMKEIIATQKSKRVSLFSRWRDYTLDQVVFNKTKNQYIDRTGANRFAIVLIILAAITAAISILTSPEGWIILHLMIFPTAAFFLLVKAFTKSGIGTKIRGVIFGGLFLMISIVAFSFFITPATIAGIIIVFFAVLTFAFP
ncbi:MAG: DUF2207 domain-containing protein, partial [archaeon]|nr:DUF2207 domain-containing protein [archaeon]